MQFVTRVCSSSSKNLLECLLSPKNKTQKSKITWFLKLLDQRWFHGSALTRTISIIFPCGALVDANYRFNSPFCFLLLVTKEKKLYSENFCESDKLEAVRVRLVERAKSTAFSKMRANNGHAVRISTSIEPKMKRRNRRIDRRTNGRSDGRTVGRTDQFLQVLCNT